MTASYKTMQATVGTMSPDSQHQPASLKPGSAPAATVVTDVATVLTDYDTFAAALIAITGDTYSTTTKQLTFGGSTGLTHAQVATLGALLNTTMTAALVVKADVAGVAAADVTVTFDATNIPTVSGLKKVLDKILVACKGGFGGLTP